MFTHGLEHPLPPGTAPRDAKIEERLVRKHRKYVTESEENEIGKRLKIARKLNKVSQVALGEKLGLSFQQIQKYERGTNRIPATRLLKIAKFLDVDILFFYGIEAGSRPSRPLVTQNELDLLRSIKEIRSPNNEENIISLMRAILREQKPNPKKKRHKGAGSEKH